MPSSSYGNSLGCRQQRLPVRYLVKRSRDRLSSVPCARCPLRYDSPSRITSTWFTYIRNVSIVLRAEKHSAGVHSSISTATLPAHVHHSAMELKTSPWQWPRLYCTTNWATLSHTSIVRFVVTNGACTRHPASCNIVISLDTVVATRCVGYTCFMLIVLLIWRHWSS